LILTKDLGLIVVLGSVKTDDQTTEWVWKKQLPPVAKVWTNTVWQQVIIVKILFAKLM
jgi:hypothetical protein